MKHEKWKIAAAGTCDTSTCTCTREQRGLSDSETIAAGCRVVSGIFIRNSRKYKNIKYMQRSEQMALKLGIIK